MKRLLSLIFILCLTGTLILPAGAEMGEETRDVQGALDDYRVENQEQIEENKEYVKEFLKDSDESIEANKKVVLDELVDMRLDFDESTFSDRIKDDTPYDKFNRFLKRVFLGKRYVK